MPCGRWTPAEVGRAMLGCREEKSSSVEGGNESGRNKRYFSSVNGRNLEDGVLGLPLNAGFEHIYQPTLGLQ